MSQLLFVACLALLAFGAVNLLASLAVGAGLHWLHADAPPRELAHRFLLLRALPSTASVLFVAALFVPAFYRHEPGNVQEEISFEMFVLGVWSSSILAYGAVRGLRSMLATRRLVKVWSRSARPLAIAGSPIPAFVIEAEFPVVAVVGVVSPRLYVARRVIERCSTRELRAILAHELTHVRHRDNLQRLFMHCAPDLLAWTPLAGKLDRAWAQASEEAADDEVARAGARLDLASALLKVARMVRAREVQRFPAMALYRGEGVAHRVGRLLRPAAQPRPRLSAEQRSWLQAACGLAFVAAMIGASFNLQSLHAITEAVVRLLQ